MAINLTNATDPHVADYLFKGMISGIRALLRERLINELEKDIDAHIETVLSQLKEMEITKDVYAKKLNIMIVKQPIKQETTPC